MVPLDLVSAAWVRSNLNWTLRSAEIRHCRPRCFTAGTMVLRISAAKRTSHRRSRSGTCCSARSTCRGGKLPEEYGVDDPNFPKDFFRQIIVPFRQFFAIVSGGKHKAEGQPLPSRSLERRGRISRTGAAGRTREDVDRFGSLAAENGWFPALEDGDAAILLRSRIRQCPQPTPSTLRRSTLRRSTPRLGAVSFCCPFSWGGSYLHRASRFGTLPP